ncbi:hypothetical protein F5B17DRAFT_379683 [Nemania serpens]|nr:hypothetical protein F5B17DRAFT_379683 [Nemania serpens]
MRSAIDISWKYGQAARVMRWKLMVMMIIAVNRCQPSLYSIVLSCFLGVMARHVPTLTSLAVGLQITYNTSSV